MQTFIPLPCVIIAGGKSSRMGSDKALLPFGGFDTLTEYQLNRLAPYFQSLHVSTKTKEKFYFSASFIEDLTEYDAASPLVALLSILETFDTPICVLSVDTPFVDASIFATLYAQLHANTDAIIAVSPSCSHQLCAIYSPRITSHIRAMLQSDEHKIRTLLQRINTVYVHFESDEPFCNLNYPHEYEAAKARG